MSKVQEVRRGRGRSSREKIKRVSAKFEWVGRVGVMQHVKEKGERGGKECARASQNEKVKENSHFSSYPLISCRFEGQGGKGWKVVD